MSLEIGEGLSCLCGGDMIGDGYTVVRHCEFCKEEEYFDKEPDGDPVYCTLEWPNPVE